jgi:ribulose-5-phosphate 4-epimerase/fuculose-1-phosphate aldolase
VTEAARLKAEIVEVGRRLYARGLIGGNEGNVSAREGDTLWITPAGVCKGFLTPDQIVATDLEGRPTAGGRASTEVLMHTAIYARRPDVKAVVHAHPPTATAKRSAARTPSSSPTTGRSPSGIRSGGPGSAWRRSSSWPRSPSSRGASAARTPCPSPT